MGKMNDLYLRKLEKMSEKERLEYEIEEDLKAQAINKHLEEHKKGDNNANC